MGLVLLLLAVYGIPAFIASVPGLWVLSGKRWLLGWSLVVGAIVVTIPGAIIADRMHTRALTEAGYVADDWPVMLVRPFFFGVLYFLVASVVCVLVPAKRSGERHGADL